MDWRAYRDGEEHARRGFGDSRLYSRERADRDYQDAYRAEETRKREREEAEAAERAAAHRRAVHEERWRHEQAEQRAAEEAVECHLCGGAMPGGDTNGHGLGECVDLCPTCGGSGDGERNTGPDPCNEPCARCLGTGGVPFAGDATP